MIPTISITSDDRPGAAPIVLVKPTVLKPERIVVGTEGELVTFSVGNFTMRLHYEDALKVSQWIRLRAKESKNRAGDRSRHWSVLGVLGDLNARL